MARSSSDEIIEGYIEEVKTYIPSLNEGIETLKQNPEDKSIIEEVHRLVHTIKGASSMIGIYGLSHIAYQMEEALDDIISGELEVSDQVLQAMKETVVRFETYCHGFRDEGVHARDMLRATVLSYRRMRNLPESEDDLALKELMEHVPEFEGGGGSEAADDMEPASEDVHAEPEEEPGIDEDLMAMLDSDGEDGGEEQDFLDQTEIDFGEMEVEYPMDAGFGDEFETAGMDTDETDFEDAEEAAPGEPVVSPELLASFNEEAEEHIEELNRCVSSLETSIVAPTAMNKNHKELVRRIRRAVHTVKGAAAVIGLPSIAGFAHSYEDLLDWLYEGERTLTPELIGTLTDSADILERIVEDPKNPRTSRVRELKAHYARIFQSTGDIPVPAAQEETAESEDRPEPREAEDAYEAAPDQDIMPELLESFYEEAEGHLEDLSNALTVLESDVQAPVAISPEKREVIRKIRRSVHTVKGAAAVIGLSGVSAFAHHFEDLLDFLYEDAKEISPENVAVMIASSDFLENIVASPKNLQPSRVESLKRQYMEIMGGGSPAKAEPAGGPPETAESGEETVKPRTVEVLETPEENVEDVPEGVAAGPMQQTKTLRVGMDRVDDLVNLTGELMIALSAFDQKMDLFMSAIDEMEISRLRLREIAREMELGYEVKSLGGMRPRGLAGGPMAFGMKPQEKKGGNGEGDFEDFDTLELDRYSELNLIIRQLNESVIDVGAMNAHLANLYSDFDGHLNRQRVILSELQDKMMQVRMTPMSTISNRMRRTVRDTARKLGKKIRLIIEGEHIELDRLVWEKITDPLMHLLRNAADHGVEPPALRQALEKAPVATIKLAASREGNQVVIRISDDGGGINHEAIRKKAREMGFVDKAEELSDEEVSAFIFQPGFSTRGKISEISGRGVGMDVVKENIQDLKGAVNVKSWKNQGTRFTIRIPLTLAAVRALLFTTGGQIYAIALNEINEIMRLEKSNFISEPENAVKIKGEILPLYYLTSALNIKKDDKESAEIRSMTNEDPIVLLVQSGGKRGALVIDSLVGQKEIVIKSTGSHLRYVKGVSGVTIMGDGSVVPILNIEDLFLSDQSSKETFAIGEEDLKQKPLDILVVDDSVSIRTVVSRLMEEQGWRVRSAKDGIDALEKLRDKRPDFIVLDIEMPRMNGYEFLSAIRTQPSYKDIPVAMLTSRTAAKHRDKAISLGAKGFIVKPYNDDEFVNLVLELTERNN